MSGKTPIFYRGFPGQNVGGTPGHRGERAGERIAVTIYNYSYYTTDKKLLRTLVLQIPTDSFW